MNGSLEQKPSGQQVTSPRKTIHCVHGVLLLFPKSNTDPGGSSTYSTIGAAGSEEIQTVDHPSTPHLAYVTIWNVNCSKK